MISASRLVTHAGLLTALIIVSGCSRLTPGYYLTPGNLPVDDSTTQSPTLVETETPLSTVQGVGVPPTEVTSEPAATVQVPSADAVTCTETEGQIVQAAMISKRTGNEFRYRVYLPPCYATSGVRYPYLIMLHGMGQGMDDTQWDRMGLDEAATEGFLDGTLPPMIIVMPNGLDAQHDWDPGPYPQMIVEDLIPETERNYCTWNTSATRMIGGLSRGGYWAFSTAFQYPDLFDRVGGHSAFFYNGDYTVTNPLDMLPSVQGIERLTVYLDRGASDTLVDDNLDIFASLIESRGVPTEYITSEPGGHAEDYWASQAANYLAFYATDWPRTIDEFPGCDLG